MSTPKFIITIENNGNRLDKFLVAKLPDLSRSEIQKMIKAGEVLVNGKAVAPHHFLKTGDEVAISNKQPTNLKSSASAKASADRKIPNLKSAILSETPDYLVLEKPSGLAVHPAPGVKEPTLADYLLEKYPAIAKVGEDPLRPGIVHRLDKEVSGLIVVAKTNDAFDDLKKQFQERKIKKEYTTLVYGEVAKDEGVIDFPIGRAESGKMAARAKTAPEEGKIAITEFNVLERFTNFTLLKVRIKTGRTHQIRVHFLAYGYPIVGDKLYKPRKLKLAELKRPFLHSTLLGFTDLAGQYQEFKSDLPEELKNFLKKLK